MKHEKALKREIEISKKKFGISENFEEELRKNRDILDAYGDIFEEIKKAEELLKKGNRNDDELASRVRRIIKSTQELNEVIREK